MLKLENYKVYKSDARNYRIEEFRAVESVDKVTGDKKSTDKWVLLPDYYNNLEHALKVLLKGDMLGKLLEEEDIDINGLLNKVNYTYSKLKIEIVEDKTGLKGE